MTPDDPRHGTVAGYGAHRRSGFPICEPCRRANTMYHKRRLIQPPKKTSSLGSRRRVRALEALGWSQPVIAKEMGLAGAGSFNSIFRSSTVTSTRAAKITEVYERLSMTIPEGRDAEVTRRRARKAGYAPPLAWDDPDLDPKPRGGRFRDADKWPAYEHGVRQTPANPNLQIGA